MKLEELEIIVEKTVTITKNDSIFSCSIDGISIVGENNPLIGTGKTPYQAKIDYCNKLSGKKTIFVEHKEINLNLPPVIKV